ncbi:MAG: spore coat protein [Oscillospiraceae bacterium]
MSNFTDKDMITDALFSQKQVTSNYNLFANECANNDTKNKFMSILNEEHDLQMQIFDEMSKRGWYNITQAQTQKVSEAKTKFSNLKQEL